MTIIGNTMFKNSALIAAAAIFFLTPMVYEEDCSENSSTIYANLISWNPPTNGNGIGLFS